MLINKEIEFDERVSIYAEEYLDTKLEKFKGNFDKASKLQQSKWERTMEACEADLELLRRDEIGLNDERVLEYAREDVLVRIEYWQKKLAKGPSYIQREKWERTLEFYWDDLDRVEELLGY